MQAKSFDIRSARREKVNLMFAPMPSMNGLRDVAVTPMPAAQLVQLSENEIVNVSEIHQASKRGSFVDVFLRGGGMRNLHGEEAERAWLALCAIANPAYTIQSAEAAA